MKKILGILLVIMIIISMCMTMSFATEAQEGDVQTQENEGELQLTEEQLQELLSQYGQEEEEKKELSTKAKIIEVKEQLEEESYYGVMIVQNYRVVITSGEHKGEEFNAKAVLGYKEDTQNQMKPYLIGQNIIIEFAEEEGGTIAYIVDVDRTNIYIVVAVILLIIIALAFLLKGTEIIGIILYNTLVITLGIMFMYFKELNNILSFSTIILAIIIGNTLILSKFKKQTFISMLSTVISTVITVGILTLLNRMLMLDMYVENFSIAALVTIIVTLGLTIDVSIRSVEKAKNGKRFIQTMKDISEKMPRKFGIAILIFAGYFTNLATSVQNYIEQNSYPSSLLNFPDISIEFVKFAVLILNPIIVMPIAVLLTKEILKPRKTIEEPKKEVKEK